MISNDRSSANGRPDPGETFDLTTTLRNFGTAATDLQVVLESSDSLVTVLDGVSDLGDVDAGAFVDNAADPFTLEVSAAAPTGRIVPLTVRATFAGGETVSDLMLCIGRFNFFVWDPTGDKSSGPEIAATLRDLGFTGTYGADLPLDKLDDYSSLWVSFGIYAENFVLEASAQQGPAIVSYMSNGGSVYLEGGDVWAYDPGVGGFNFGPHFGVNGSADGSADMSHVLGLAGEFSEGMDFVYNGENSYMDHLVPVGSGFVLLSNSSPAYNCGIAQDAGTYRTIATSFELSGLVDGTEPSTRATLVQSIMDFFGITDAGPLFADGFEAGNVSAWSEAVQ